MSRKIQTVYVAGAITPKGLRKDLAIEYIENKRLGLLTTGQLMLKGYYVYSPFFDDQICLQIGADLFETIDIRKHNAHFIQYCDAVVVIGAWQRSAGTKHEIGLAKELGIPVFYGLTEFLEREK